MADEKTPQHPDFQLKLIHMNDVQETKTHWLWYPYIPYGKITIIQGDPGEGKTTLVLHLAAALTRGEMLGSEDHREPVTVIDQTAEDGLTDTKERQRGLKKGVSMRAAMIEQGFAPQHGGKNQLVLWEESERKIMELILHRNGYERDEKDAYNPHLTVEEYKTVQDTKRLEAVLKQSRTLSASDMQAEAVRRMKSELNALHQTVSTLEEQKYSPYKSFFYASDDKLGYMMQQLTAEQIPYHETENGFEAQECYAQRIREIERSYKVPHITARDRLRDDIDRYAFTAKSFKELLQMLNHAGYSIKLGKYISLKHWDGERYIRL